MSDINPKEANAQTRTSWNENAAYWDERMGDDGNDFVETLIWPTTQRLLQPGPGQHILDIACGTGLYSRKLAALGAQITAFDFAAEMVARARTRSSSRPARAPASGRTGCRASSAARAGASRRDPACEDATG